MNKELKHVAIIMDGNGRWAKKRLLPVSFGHNEGVKRIEDVIKVAINNNIEIVTLFAFSTENWKREEKEVKHLMKLVKKYYLEKRHFFQEEQICFNLIGSRKNIPKEVMTIFDNFMEETKDNKKLILNIAFNYGSRLEIVEAVNNIIQSKLESISEQQFSEFLYTKEQPDVDLLIRTSGEQRLSNFLLWQCAYAELFFTNTLWPDFKQTEFQNIIDLFYQRERRFGGR